MSESPFNVLLLEDVKTDAELIKRQMLKAMPNSVFAIAHDRATFFEKLEWAMPDIILADYNLPDINGLEALLHIREKWPHIPFMFVSGTLNDEEKVADAVLNGASGYVLKENLHLLPEKLKQVLKKAATHKAAAKEQERRWREAALNLQKALALLSQAEDFEKKEVVEALLSEALRAVQE